MVKKRIMFFLYALSGGGAERTVINIMNNLNREKYEVLLVIGTDNNNDYKDLLAKDIHIEVLNSKKLRFSILKLRKCIKERKPDLLFSTVNPNNIILLLSRTLMFKNIPTIVREANNRTQSGSVTNTNKRLTSFLYNYQSDKIIALSEGVREDLISNFRIKSGKIDVIYNPVEVENINSISKENVMDISKHEDEKLIIAVGRLVEQKDFVTLIKAFHIVSNKIKSRLLILGKGPLEEKLHELVKSLNLEDKVIFKGFEKNPYKYMRKSDVFVLSSRWEGFGHVIVEAMASETAVIATNCKSGPSEIIEHEKNGVLVPVGSYEEIAKQLLKILENKELQLQYAKAGYERAKKFNAKSIVRQYEEVFDELLIFD